MHVGLETVLSAIDASNNSEALVTVELCAEQTVPDESAAFRYKRSWEVRPVIRRTSRPS